MAKTVGHGGFRLRVKVVPCEGYEMIRVTKGEFLFLEVGDPQRNHLVDGHAMAGVFVDLANGGLREGAEHGFGTFWEVVEVVESDH
jgi:hypothetical protein